MDGKAGKSTLLITLQGIDLSVLSIFSMLEEAENAEKTDTIMHKIMPCIATL